MKNSRRICEILVNLAVNDELPMDMNELSPDHFLELDTPNSLEQRLQDIWNSCEEGYTEAWNPVGEGADGFLSMQEIIVMIGQSFGIEITEYTGDIIKPEDTEEND